MADASHLSSPFVRVASIASLASSARHQITLRHRVRQHGYHSLLLFSFPSPNGSVNVFYCMEASCPHLGAPLENASIYDVDDEDDIEDAVIVCPWHEYDFSLSTGESSTGLKACTYAVEERDGDIWIQEPSLEDDEPMCNGRMHDGNWEVVEIRTVSEDFAPSRQTAAQHLHSATARMTLEDSIRTDLKGDDRQDPSSVHDPTPPPRTLTEWATLVLNTPDPKQKVEYTRRAARAFRSGECKGGIGGGRWRSRSESGQSNEKFWLRKESETPPDIPPRLDNTKIVLPGREVRRGKGGSEKSRIAMLHSLANIEQWAIDLAWDIIVRSSELYVRHTASSPSAPRSLPLQFYSDWVKVAEDEAKHYSLLQARLQDLGTSFGDLPVHHGLWESASETKHSLLSRLSIIHLVHEARGLDANPLTIKKFENAGDMKSVETLKTIHLDEVTHVSAGHRWLSYLCSKVEPPISPVEVFRREVKNHFAGRLKGPFNAPDRLKAGLSKEWYEGLVGEKRREDMHSGGGIHREEIPGG